MANLSSSSESMASEPRGSTFSIVALTALFFMWGAITSLNDVLIPHLKSVFSLTYTKAMLVQFCFFGAYFLISIPAGKLIKKVGFQYGISIGLVISALGALLFVPSAWMELYWLFLGALFVLAAGVTILQVTANPLMALIGDPKNASSRLTLAQGFNSLGTTVAPIIGGWLLFSDHIELEGAKAAVETVIPPYLGLAAVAFLLGMLFLKLTLPVPDANEADVPVAPDSSDAERLWHHRHLILGALGIFVYVGAEVAIGSFLVNYLGESYIAGMPESTAANYIAFYWGGAMVGRFIGALLMRHIPARLLLAFCSFCSIALIVTSVASSGSVAMWTILAVGLCNSIMFPTIFSLALKGLGKSTSQGSGLLCLAIVGGAIVPVFQGMLADSIGLQLSFLLPALCYVYIGFYGLKGSIPRYEHLANVAEEKRA
ncbi:Glucose/galactose transporter [Saliniradius amylolyticus]|uniref:Glucose/galactose transporter n=1 Tax=Saliniradius amylolyticus TaxID=2183582 RepID=A0A2S2E166_9ALTE|nr:sugar MFS transporter [Saliniradius amylolyticus]AWL11388.1 Glucose/galactose transporter [Saliniradius amylolyticus]